MSEYLIKRERLHTESGNVIRILTCFDLQQWFKKSCRCYNRERAIRDRQFDDCDDFVELAMKCDEYHYPHDSLTKTTRMRTWRTPGSRGSSVPWALNRICNALHHTSTITFGPFSAVSTPIFARKYSLESSSRDLQDLHAFAPLRPQYLRKCSSKHSAFFGKILQKFVIFEFFSLIFYCSDYDEIVGISPAVPL